jgi:hypothetical protein
MKKKLKEFILKTSQDKLFKNGLFINNNVKSDINTDVGLCELLFYKRAKDEKGNLYLDIQILQINEDSANMDNLTYMLLIAMRIKDYLNIRSPKLLYRLQIVILGDETYFGLHNLSEFLSINNPNYNPIVTYSYVFKFNNYFFTEYISSRSDKNKNQTFEKWLQTKEQITFFNKIINFSLEDKIKWYEILGKQIENGK